MDLNATEWSNFYRVKHTHTCIYLPKHNYTQKQRLSLVLSGLFLKHLKEFFTPIMSSLWGLWSAILYKAALEILWIVQSVHKIFHWTYLKTTDHNEWYFMSLSMSHEDILYKCKLNFHWFLHRWIKADAHVNGKQAC